MPAVGWHTLQTCAKKGAAGADPASAGGCFDQNFCPTRTAPLRGGRWTGATWVTAAAAGQGLAG